MTRIRSHVLLAAMLLALAPSVSFGQSVADLEAQLAEARHQVSAPPAGTSRFDLLRKCDSIEKRLIAAAPADDRRATWLADRAASALDLAGEDGADLAVLFGLPTSAQADRVRARAGEALELANQADQAAGQTVARLEAELVGQRKPGGAGGAGELAARVERTLSSLIDVEQAQRIPQVRALARVLLGASGRDQAARDAAQGAAKELGALPAPGPEASAVADARRVAIGAALIHASMGAPERAEDWLKAGAAQLEPVARKYVPGVHTPESGAALKARLGLLRAGREVAARPRSGDEALEREIDTLEADARAAFLFDRATREPAARNVIIASAIRVLLDAPHASGGADGARLRAYDKIAAALPPGIALERLPPEAMLAKAVSRVRESGMSDAPAREDAASILGRLAERTDASAALRSQARWERAVIIAAGNDPIGELDALGPILRAVPEDERTIPAAKRIGDLFAREQGAADGFGTLPEPWRTRIPMLRESLTLLLRADGANAARWREESTRLCLHELAGSGALDALDWGFDLLAAMPEAERPQHAALSEALWRVIDQRRGAAVARLDSLGPSLAKKDWQALLPAATRARTRAHAADPAREPAYALVVGECLVVLDDAKAIGLLSGLVAGPAASADSPLWTRFRFALAGAHRLAGDHASALATLREIADRFEGEPGQAARDPAYWRAWTEMLTVLQSQNAGGVRSPDIRVQIKRLELLDAKLGGSPWDERIRRIKTQVGQ